MKRPLAVTLLGLLFIGAGAAGIIFHSTERPINAMFFAIEAVGVVAVLGGASLLMGREWARWVLLAWMAFHVAIGAVDSVGKFAFHVVLFVVIGYVMFRPGVGEYFKTKRKESGS
jgi:hypothetical protein